MTTTVLRKSEYTGLKEKKKKNQPTPLKQILILYFLQWQTISRHRQVLNLMPPTPIPISQQCYPHRIKSCHFWVKEQDYLLWVSERQNLFHISNPRYYWQHTLLNTTAETIVENDSGDSGIFFFFPLCVYMALWHTSAAWIGDHTAEHNQKRT